MTSELSKELSGWQKWIGCLANSCIRNIEFLSEPCPWHSAGRGFELLACFCIGFTGGLSLFCTLLGYPGGCILLFVGALAQIAIGAGSCLTPPLLFLACVSRRRLEWATLAMVAGGALLLSVSQWLLTHADAHGLGHCIA